MKSASLMLEQLEPRIAPAVVVFTNGGNLLSAGDQGYLSEANTDGDASMLVKCTGGKALVFWDAIHKEITGISVSNGANIEVNGDIKGDIVTNLQASGFLSDSDNNPANGLDGGKLLPSSIAGIKTNAYFDSKGNAQNGDIGRIIAGGSISNVNLSGGLSGVYTGDGIFDAVASAALPNGSSTTANGIAGTQFTFVLGQNFDTSGLSNISTMTLKMSDATFASNASINGVTFASGINAQFFAGDGTDGATGTALIGGSVSKLSFVGSIVDSGATGLFFGKSYTVSAGDGGHTTNGTGGIGGSINGITETGSGGNVFIHAGLGGNGSLTKGSGGNGGSISNLDLQGGVINYDILAGNGGNGASGGLGGSVAYTNITSQGAISLAGPFLGNMSTADANKNFFVINQSTSDMALVLQEWVKHTDSEGVETTTLDWVSHPIQALASGAVDAIATDLNGDNYLDVAVVYSDGHLGILLNKGAAATSTDAFDYTTKALGFQPAHIVAGNFLGDGGNPELAIISSSKILTTVRLFSADSNRADAVDTAPADAGSYQSNTTLFKPLVLKKGGLVDVAGGSSPLSGGNSLQLNPEETKTTTAHSDLVLAFADGTLQGLFASGDAKPKDATDLNSVDKPFSFTTKDAPKTVVGGGIRDIDFNFGTSSVGTSDQALAVVNKAGSSAFVVTIAPVPPPEPVEGQPTPVVSTTFVFNTQSALPLPSGAGTILQASWTQHVLTSTDNTLTLLSTTSTNSKLIPYKNYNGDTMEPMKSLEFDFQVNSVSNNSLFSGSASAYYFTIGNLSLGNVVDHALPGDDPIVISYPVPQSFEGTTIHLTSGNGGTGMTGSGGNGGDLRSLNFDSNVAVITAGDGGTSSVGAGGNGGSVYNSASFSTSTATITPSMGAGVSLQVYAGNGASVSGTGLSSKGGQGGSINGVTFTTSGGYLTGQEDKPSIGSIALLAGAGGDSESLAAGNGGSISSTKIFSAGHVFLQAGDGGLGKVGSKAQGGNGGSVNGLIGGDVAGKAVEERTRFIVGNVAAYAGMGGDSDSARAGNGGSVSSINVQNMKDGDSSTAQVFNLEAGNGGNSLGLNISANGGSGGAISGVTFESSDVTPTMVAGQGGDAVGGSGGAGGSLMNLDYTGGVINLASGNGGNSSGALSKGTGGIGGAISGIKAKITGSGYMSLTSGIGGSGDISGGGASGGAGGAISTVVLKLNPSDKAAADETLGISVISGDGGLGSKGGNGGAITGVSCEGVYDNPANDGFVTVIDSIAMKFVSGKGGQGYTAEGGAGGAINFSKSLLGLSQIDADSTNVDFKPSDEALRIISGNGGEGATKGGAGGLIYGLQAANVKNGLGDSISTNLLSGAFLQSGNGGTGNSSDAGAGGNISGVKLTVERQGDTDPTGNLHVVTGTGGESTAGKGGAGGSITGSSFTSVNGNPDDGYGLFLQTGNGGTGTKTGGAGGNLTTLTVSVGSTATNSTMYGAVLVAGNGGNANGVSKAVGGAGGSISGLSQLKDAYSVINLLQAGSGGNSSADVAGGIGGSVSSVKSAGAIGAQKAGGTLQGQFNTFAASATIDSLSSDLQQGIFAGLGGMGATRGVNGSVTGISAPAIAAIGAANLSGTFEAAAVINKITTFILGYDVDANGTYQSGDGFVQGTKFDVTKDLVSIDPSIVSNASLINRTTPFVIS